ncbi:MAG: exodeoxyribonuclease subunit gamma, partial [Pseudomonadota bacterium]
FPATITEDQLHLHSNPLLAAWGKQGRDFVRLLDEWDDPENTRRIGFQKIDVYQEVPEAQANLLQQVQNAILNLEPLPSPPTTRTPVALEDHSIAFHIAHSPQREVEVLHDQLLRLFDHSSGVAATLTPADVIVMVPDIDRYAPHIEAVFGQFDSRDARNIPFSLADRRQRGHNPIHVALEYLLGLPEARITSSEILDLLDLDAVQQRFGLSKDSIPLLRRWILESGVRWGLDASHRHALELGADLAQNTWQFGLDRMLLGYCMGHAADYHEITPYDEIAGIESANLGPLCLFMQRIADYRAELALPATPAEWAKRLENLFDAFFKAGNTADRRSLDRLKTSLAQWLTYCQSAQLEETLPLAVVREAWLSSLDEPDLSQRFLAGRVNFCTLMPMRAIPFKVVCLLGMNDGDFPRSQPQRTFDLMRIPGAYRPGDRAQREDDRYMFLEALLSAREKLLISWVGRSIRDDSEIPASVLVSQLQDYLQSGWMLAQDQSPLLDHLTLSHALQPFSTRYFTTQQDARWFSYAHEWRTSVATGSQPASTSHDNQLQAPKELESVSLRKLERFLKNPVTYFFNERLSVYFENEASKTEDSESFVLDRLQQHVLANDLLKARLSTIQSDEDYSRYLTTQRQQGSLPLAGFGANIQMDLDKKAGLVADRYQSLLKEWGEVLPHPHAIQGMAFELGDHRITLDDWLTQLRQHRHAADQYAIIQTRPSAVLSTKGKISHHHLTSLWIQHLAANAADFRTQSYLVGTDSWIELAPMTKTDAHKVLETLVAAWYVSLQAPLPVAPKTAFAYLSSDKEPLAAAQKSYAGDGYTSEGEMGYDAYLKRAYPSFDALTKAAIDGKHFTDWLNLLYQPLFKTANVKGEH